MEIAMMNDDNNSRFCKELVTSLKEDDLLADFAASLKGTNCEAKLERLTKEVGLEAALTTLIKERSWEPSFDEITLADYKREKSNIMRRAALHSADSEKFADRLEEIEEEASASPEGDAAKLLKEMTATYLAFVEGDKLLKRLDKFISECGWDESDD
jgi:hypothetical protein